MAGRKRADVASTGMSAELAGRLRALRDESHLTLRQLAARSGFSASTLSLAESGRAVPSWDLVAAFVQACGQSPARWRQLWEITRAQAAASAILNVPSTAAATQGTAATDDSLGTIFQAAGDQPQATAPVHAGRRRVAILAGTAVLAAAITAVAIVTLAPAGTRKPAALVGQPNVTAAKDGTDPYDDRCKADEKQLDWQPVLRASHVMFGTIVLMYSPACQAAWGYLDGLNSTAWTTHIIAHRIPGNATAPSQFSGNAAYGSWGNVLSTRTGCVYIEAYVTDRTGQGPHAKTACVQPHPPVAP